VARSNLPRIRKICLGLPEATEVEAWGAPTFRIGKIFAMYAAAGNGHHEGEGIWVKTDSFTQDLLVRGQPGRYFKPPYVGPQGWTGVFLSDQTDWIAVTDLLREAYRATAPKRLAALMVDDEPPVASTKAISRRKSPTQPVKKTARKRVAKKSAKKR
jgi:hypothetical protein